MTRLAAPILVFASAVLLAQEPASKVAQEGVAPFPTRAWEASTPEAEGIDPEVLKEVDAALRSGRYKYVDSMLVIRNGRVVFDRSYPKDYVKVIRCQDQVDNWRIEPGTVWQLTQLGARQVAV